MTVSHAPSGLPVIKACLFDMDGLLINSEDIYTDCTNLVLQKHGKGKLPWNIKARLQGRPGPEASALLQEWAQLPISMEQFKSETSELQALYFPNTQPLPGVDVLLKELKGSKVGMAVATSSHRTNFEIKTRHLQTLFEVFDSNHVVVGDDPRIPSGRGKPAPDIYLLALQTINDQLPEANKLHPEECLVFEDSVPGVEAGRRAGMQVVWVPHPGLLEVYAGREHEVLAGLTGEHVDDNSEYAKSQQDELEKKRDEWVTAGRKFARVQGCTGELEDGWARMYHTLEDFPFDYYGIEKR